MTFLRKHSGDSTRPIIAVYTCPEHGEFDALVQRDERGEAPDMITCPVDTDCYGCGGQYCSGCKVCDGRCHAPCGNPCTWTPSPVAGRVRLVEAVRGKWEKPERKTFLDTRELGEGQSMEEFRAKRAKIWDDQRKAEVMKMVRE